jgi:hypothetical protein
VSKQGTCTLVSKQGMFFIAEQGERAFIRPTIVESVYKISDKAM